MNVCRQTATLRGLMLRTPDGCSDAVLEHLWLSPVLSPPNMSMGLGKEGDLEKMTLVGLWHV